MVSERISALAGGMRARGARVGVGEVLGAHRALAAVDAADPTDGRLALRAALCSSHAELEIFDQAWAEAFPEPEFRDPFDELGAIGRLSLPRLGVPAVGEEDFEADMEPVPAAW